MDLNEENEGFVLNLRAGRKRAHAGELLLTSMIDMFTILIVFLLMTAEFVQLSIVDLSLPSVSRGEGGKVQQPPPETLVLVVLAIKEDGFQLKSPGFVFDPIAKDNEKYNYTTLDTQLKQIKEKYPTAEDLIVSPEAKVKYDIIIKVMDHSREVGFPNVSLAG
jgi:biopolymer transport protein ExbD